MPRSRSLRDLIAEQQLLNAENPLDAMQGGEIGASEVQLPTAQADVGTSQKVGTAQAGISNIMKVVGAVAGGIAGAGGAAGAAGGTAGGAAGGAAPAAASSGLMGGLTGGGLAGAAGQAVGGGTLGGIVGGLIGSGGGADTEGFMAGSKEVPSVTGGTGAAGAAMGAKPRQGAISGPKGRTSRNRIQEILALLGRYM